MAIVLLASSTSASPAILKQQHLSDEYGTREQEHGQAG
jgi:hypothetical protein